jgi:hypothetical protein
MTPEEYLYRLLDWLRVAVQLNLYDSETAKRLYGEAESKLSARPLWEVQGELPFVTEILAGESPEELLFQQREVARQRRAFVETERERLEALGRRLPGREWVRVGERLYPVKIPPVPSAQLAYERFLETLTPAMRRYFEAEGRDIFARFAEEKPEARQEWWRELKKAEFAEKMSRRRRRHLLIEARRLRRELAELQAKRPEIRHPEEALPEREREIIRRLAQIEPEQAELKRKIRKGHFEMKVERAGIDPWQQYLKGFPFLQKFLATPPRERGFFPSRFAPPARWLVGF